jgi:hypothetical protein
MKRFFRKSPISYSQFLQSRGGHIHHLTEAKEAVDIEFFRRTLSMHYQNVYATKKWQNWLYRLLFFTFGLLFLVFGVIIFFKTANFACGFYFKNCLLVKNCIDVFCLLMAVGAFAIAYKIHPEKEAVHYLMGKVEKELKHPEKNLQVEFDAILSNLSQEYLTPHQTVWINRTLNS